MSILDTQILGWFYALRSPKLDLLFMNITWLGSLCLLGPLSIGGLLWRGRALLALPVALLVASLLAFVTKLVVGRERPALFDAIIVIPAEPSWPSSHAAQATAFAVAAILLAPAPRRYRLAGLLLPLVIAVGFSRLYLQVHWPSDVLAGLLLGGAVALLARRWLPQPSSLR